MIHLGFGFYRKMLTNDYYRFARQCGATHAIVHLVDYNNTVNQPIGDKQSGWGFALSEPEVWSVPFLTKIRREMEQEGLTFYGIENFSPADWYDVLLDGPKRAEQMENLKQIIRNLGEAGIQVMGYNFSLAGVTGRTEGPFARGGGISVGMDSADQTPIPDGVVWNMRYRAGEPNKIQPRCTHEQLWERVERFLKELVPVAEASGVRLAAHPDDPPVPELRSTPRLVYKLPYYDKLYDLCPSKSNCYEYCLGTVTEMGEDDLYEATRRYALAGRLAYIHMRNIHGHAPHYHETFIDEGDLDIRRIIQILHGTDYEGVIIPDHAPLMTCDAPWNAGMAFALGYLKALL